MSTHLVTSDVRGLPFPNNYFHAAVTSPPYYLQRDYLGNPDQIGQETELDCLGWSGVKKPCGECYICHILEALEETARVVRPDGTTTFHLADKYTKKDHQAIPQRVILGAKLHLGLIVVGEIPWVKENPIPDPASTRPGISTESLMIFAKSRNYYWDNQGAKRHLGIKRNFRNGDLIQCVQTYNNKGFTGDHDASFPPELVAPIINAAVSEAGCCSVCGKPHVRILKKNFTPQADHPTPETRQRSNTNGNNWGSSTRGTTSYKTLGWEPSCHHDHSVKPCRVIDPFGGTGATALAAPGMNLSVYLSDLNHAYLSDEARSRVGATSRSTFDSPTQLQMGIFQNV